MTFSVTSAFRERWMLKHKRNRKRLSEQVDRRNTRTEKHEDARTHVPTHLLTHPHTHPHTHTQTHPHPHTHTPFSTAPFPETDFHTPRHTWHRPSPHLHTSPGEEDQAVNCDTPHVCRLHTCILAMTVPSLSTVARLSVFTSQPKLTPQTSAKDRFPTDKARFPAMPTSFPH